MAHSDRAGDRGTDDGRLIDFAQQVEATHEATDDPESHREADPSTFHPSQLATTCLRQAFLAVCDLKKQTHRGSMKGGELMHGYMETEVAPRIRAQGRRVSAEQSVEVDVEVDGRPITITGTADLLDHGEGVVYDYKTRSNWWHFDGAEQRHRDQLHLYMLATGMAEAQVVYMTRSKWEVRQWPACDDDVEGETFTFDPGRIEALVRERAVPIRDALEAEGIPESADAIPFQKCDGGDEEGEPCWLCQREELKDHLTE